MASGGRVGTQGRRGGGGRHGRDRTVVASIREATGASVEDIKYQLRECEGDVNKATEQLIDCPFTVVQSKKPRSRPQVRGRGRGGGRRGGGEGGRGYRQGNRGRWAQSGRGRGQNRSKDNPITPNIEEESAEVEHKTETPTPPVPKKKAYLEALCGGSKTPDSKEIAISQGVANGIESGWEEATSPLEYILPDRGAVKDDIDHSLTHVQEEFHIPRVSTVHDKKGKNVEDEEEELINTEVLPEQETEDLQGLEMGKAENVFPIAMEDIRFTREDTKPIVAACLPIPIKMDREALGIPMLDANPPDMSDLKFIFGTFAGLYKTEKIIETVSSVEHSSSQIGLEEDPPSVPMVSNPTTVEEEAEEQKPRPEELELSESFNVGVSLRSQEIELENRIAQQSITQNMDPSISLESYGTSTSPAALVSTDNTGSEFRIESTDQIVDLEAQTPGDRSFLTTGMQSSPIAEDSNPQHHLIGPDCRQEKSSLPSTMQVLDETDYTKKYRTEINQVEIQNSEDLGSAFEPTETRQTQHKTPAIVESKPVIESETSYNISSGPTPSLPSYQPQRHQTHPTHKLSEKNVPSVGTNPVASHQTAGKYNNHQGPGTGSSGGGAGGGAGVTGQNPGHVPVTLNSNNNSNGANPSLPMMAQLPFLNPGMLPNPAMPFPTGPPYYPQFMQYQHQLYHGMYHGTYGGFGGPFNHESVGHPPHVNPPGVPSNQGNQQFPVSFPNALYTLGNTVYDMANPNSFSNNKDKDTMFLAQQQQVQHGFPGGPQPVPRNDGSLFYGMPGQAFTQGVRSQYHQAPGYATQFPGAGVVAPPHTYHPSGQQGNNFRLQ